MEQPYPGPEQELAVLMGRLGPVVAIGKPGERLPELGAARLYVADDRTVQIAGEDHEVRCARRSG